MVNFPQTRVDMHNMVGESFDMSHEPHGSQAHGRIPYFVCLGPFWAMLGHFGPCWARVGTILGLSWAILGYVGTFWAMLDPCWAHLGPFWAIFGFVSAFVLDSGISASLTFRSCKRVQKTKIPGKIQFVDYVADGFWCYWGGGVGGGMERVQTQFLMTESAGTAQGVDVALP